MNTLEDFLGADLRMSSGLFISGFCNVLHKHDSVSDLLQRLWMKNYKKLVVYTECRMRNMFWRGQSGKPPHFDTEDVLQVSFQKTLQHFRDKPLPQDEDIEQVLLGHFCNQIRTYLSNEAHKLENTLTASYDEESENDKISNSIPDPPDTDNQFDTYFYRKLVDDVKKALSDDQILFNLFHYKYILGIDEIDKLSKVMSISRRDVHNSLRRLKRFLESFQYEVAS